MAAAALGEEVVRKLVGAGLGREVAGIGDLDAERLLVPAPADEHVRAGLALAAVLDGVIDRFRDGQLHLAPGERAQTPAAEIRADLFQRAADVAEIGRDATLGEFLVAEAAHRPAVAGGFRRARWAILPRRMRVTVSSFWRTW